MADQEQNRKSGEQLDLIDVAPENAKEIITVAKSYKEFQTVRLAALKNETEQKDKIKEMVAAAGLQRLPDGKIKFSYDGFEFTLTPQDDKISIKEKEYEEE